MKVAKPQSHGLDPARLDRISVWMQRYVKERKFAGSSILVARHGEEVYHATAGMADMAAGTPFRRDTLARIYSMTKPITTTAIMMLAERGLFHLDTPVSRFIPAFGKMRALVPGASGIDQCEPCLSPTLHQLLTHTAGLSYPFNPGLLPEEMRRRRIGFDPGAGPLAEMVDRLAELPLAFQPGKAWEYSAAIDVLGRVVELVSGESLARFFEQHIFAPLRMQDTGFSAPEGKRRRLAALYTPLDGDAMALNEARRGAESLRLCDSPANSDFLDPSMLSGGGGLVGGIDDYMRFAEMLRQGGSLDGARILSSKTVEFMRRNHLPGDIASMGPRSFAEQPMEGMGFGLGGSVVLDPARTRMPGSVGDFSWGGMASTFFWIDPVHELSVVFFTQLSPSSAYPARAELKALVHGAIID